MWVEEHAVPLDWSAGMRRLGLTLKRCSAKHTPNRNGKQIGHRSDVTPDPGCNARYVLKLHARARPRPRAYARTRERT